MPFRAGDHNAGVDIAVIIAPGGIRGLKARKRE
jgi:hypothetical protein